MNTNNNINLRLLTLSDSIEAIQKAFHELSDEINSSHEADSEVNALQKELMEVIKKHIAPSSEKPTPEAKPAKVGRKPKKVEAQPVAPTAQPDPFDTDPFSTETIVVKKTPADVRDKAREISGKYGEEGVYALSQIVYGKGLGRVVDTTPELAPEIFEAFVALEKTLSQKK